MGEGELKPIRLGAHFMHLEGDLSCPVDALEGERFFAMGSPTPIGASCKHAAVCSKAGHDITGTKALKEWEGSPLVVAVNFLQKDTMNLGVGLLRDK